MKRYRVIITPGEPAGIGIDLVIQLAQYSWPVELVVCADPSLLQDRAKLLGLPLILLPYQPYCQPVPQKASTLMSLPVTLRAPVVPGQLRTENSFYVIETLSKACDGCLKGEFSAIITGPVHKGIINETGIPFIGHTEFFEQRTNSRKAVMMLVSEKIRVALVTTHLPVKLISQSITRDLLRKVINVLNHNLYTKFGIFRPHIMVCSLNPHAGENGYIGTEEIDIILPVLKEMREKGIILSGPLPVDTLFQKKYLDRSDVILAMYHDQGIPVLKCQKFGHIVNITLGLPFIRTSVDHGTALSLAGKKKANVSSFFMALNLAIKLVINNKKNEKSIFS